MNEARGDGPFASASPLLLEHRIRAASRELLILSPPSVDDLMEVLQEVDAIPFWAQVWDSSRGLCTYLNELASGPAPGGLLLELGCGVGTVGCVAAALGWQVTMTDFRPEALQYAACNMARNGLTAGLAVVDWREPAVRPVFDLVVGSDILYEPSVHADLARMLGEFRAAGATIILSDPGRDYALQFMALREKEGWPIELELRNGNDGPVGLYIVRPTGTQQSRIPFPLKETRE
ncbi:MAG: methyltransferase domain-containing protein [Armatimonadota bacterium]|nr:methyltransferase domain-containing protein [Armatimonadota bacterium]